MVDVDSNSSTIAHIIITANVGELATPHLRTGEHVNVPLLVPWRPLGELAGSDKPHNVGHAVVDEADLAPTLVVRTVESRTADSSFLDQNQGGSVRLPAKREF